MSRVGGLEPKAPNVQVSGVLACPLEVSPHLFLTPYKSTLVDS